MAEKNIEFIEPKEERKEIKRSSFRGIIDGSMLTSSFMSNQLVFIIFLSFMALLYIANRYNSEKIMRKNLKMQEEVKELRAEAISYASELMFISCQSEVIKFVQQNNLELQEAVRPPLKIIVNRDELDKACR